MSTPTPTTQPGQASLLRGINVGGHALVPMARLREIYEALGLDDVRTHLQSGNVVFRSTRTPDGIATEAEAALLRECARPIRVLGRDHADLARVVAANPFPTADPSRHIVVFLSAPPPPDATARIVAAAANGEQVHVGAREWYIHYPGGAGTSRITNAMLQRGGLVATGRNWRTVTRLLDLTAPAIETA